MPAACADRSSRPRRLSTQSLGASGSMISRRRAGWRRGGGRGGIQTRLQQSRVEGQRQQILELVSAGLALEIREDDFEITAELPQDLTARAAGRRRGFGVGNDGDAAEFAMAF